MEEVSTGTANRFLKQRGTLKKELGLDSAHEQRIGYETPPHGNLKRLSPTLFALAIPAIPLMTPKQWQEPPPLNSYE